MILRSGQHVQTLIQTMGAYFDDNDEEIEVPYPAGMVGIVDHIGDRGELHVAIGPEGKRFVNVFEAGQEAQQSIRVLNMPTTTRAKVSVSFSVNGNGDGYEYATLEETAAAAEAFITGIDPHDVGRDFRIDITLLEDDDA